MTIFILVLLLSNGISHRLPGFVDSASCEQAGKTLTMLYAARWTCVSELRPTAP
jgi:hypothetical protein